MNCTATRLGAVVLAGLVSACGSGPPGRPGPHAPDGPGGPPQGQLQEAMMARPVALLFTGMDANHDLRITEEELAKGVADEFARADVDHSGAASGFEMADWCKAAMGDPAALPDLREMDTDLNHTVTPREFADALKRQFMRMDRNGDGGA